MNSIKSDNEKFEKGIVPEMFSNEVEEDNQFADKALKIIQKLMGGHNFENELKIKKEQQRQRDIEQIQKNLSHLQRQNRQSIFVC